METVAAFPKGTLPWHHPFFALSRTEAPPFTHCCILQLAVLAVIA